MLFLVASIGFVWGAFLNWWSGRLLANALPLKSTHFCAQCKRLVRWRSAGLFVWKLLKSGKCHACSSSLLWRFPLFELAAAGAAVVMWQFVTALPVLTPYHLVARLICYGLFVSGLFVASRTDFQAMVIPYFVILTLLPVGLMAAGMGLLPFSFATSLIGGACGYGVLWLLGKLARVFLKKDGIGIGDVELLGVIGLFVGPIGVWAVMLISSLLGSVCIAGYLFFSGKGRDTQVPFGPFLALATLIYLANTAWFSQVLTGL